MHDSATTRMREVHDRFGWRGAGDPRTWAAMPQSWWQTTTDEELPRFIAAGWIGWYSSHLAMPRHRRRFLCAGTGASRRPSHLLITMGSHSLCVQTRRTRRAGSYRVVLGELRVCYVLAFQQRRNVGISGGGRDAPSGLARRSRR